MNDEFSEFFIAGIVGVLGWFFGGLDGFTQVLIACTVVDYITGVCKAGYERKLNSQIEKKFLKCSADKKISKKNQCPTRTIQRRRA